jgi:hypothetical protein
MIRLPFIQPSSLSGAGRAVLFAAVGVVWLAVGIQLYRGVWSGDEVVVSAVSSGHPPDADVVYAPRPFRGEFPDPFSEAPTTAAPQEHYDYGDFDYGSENWTSSHWPSAAPPLVLRGVVGGTAMLETHGDEVVLVSEGMSLGDVDIVIVERDHVVVQFQGEFHTLLLTTDLAESRH